MLAQDFSDARHFAGADEQVDLRQFSRQFVRDSAATDSRRRRAFLTLPDSFRRRNFENGIDGFFLGGADEAAGVDHARYRRPPARATISVIVFLQQPRHDLGIDQIAGAAQTDDLNFCLVRIIGLALRHRRRWESGLGNRESFDPTPLRMLENRSVVRLLAASRTLTQRISEEALLTPSKNLVVTARFALGLQAQDMLGFLAGFEGSVEIFFKIAQAQQKRQRNIAAKRVLERALDHLILLGLIEIKMLAVGEHKLSFRRLRRVQSILPGRLNESLPEALRLRLRFLTSVSWRKSATKSDGGVIVSLQAIDNRFGGCCFPRRGRLKIHRSKRGHEPSSDQPKDLPSLLRFFAHKLLAALAPSAGPTTPSRSICFDHPRGAVVPYPQSPLNHRDRRLLGLGDDGDRLVVHLVVFFVGRQRRLRLLSWLRELSGR